MSAKQQPSRQACRSSRIQRYKLSLRPSNQASRQVQTASRGNSAGEDHLTKGMKKLKLIGPQPSSPLWGQRCAPHMPHTCAVLSMSLVSALLFY